MRTESLYAIAGIGFSVAVHVAIIGAASIFWKSEVARKVTVRLGSEASLERVSVESDARIEPSLGAGPTAAERPALGEVISLESAPRFGNTGESSFPALPKEDLQVKSDLFAPQAQQFR